MTRVKTLLKQHKETKVFIENINILYHQNTKYLETQCKYGVCQVVCQLTTEKNFTRVTQVYDWVLNNGMGWLALCQSLIRC